MCFAVLVAIAVVCLLTQTLSHHVVRSQAEVQGGGGHICFLSFIFMSSWFSLKATAANREVHLCICSFIHLLSQVYGICVCARVYSHGCGHMCMGRYGSYRLILLSSLIALFKAGSLFKPRVCLLSQSNYVACSRHPCLCSLVLGIKLSHCGPQHLFGCQGSALKSLNLLAQKTLYPLSHFLRPSCREVVTCFVY